MKVYFFLPAIADMLLFTKPATGKIHVRYHSRNTSECGKPITGQDVPEAPESQLCSRCLHSVQVTDRGHFSYREIEEPASIVGPRCAICHNEARSFLWQPGLQSLYLPGSHIRGFVAIAIGDVCIQRMQSGETLEFTYRKMTYQANRSGYVEEEVVQ
jgi:hypothetical protein